MNTQLYKIIKKLKLKTLNNISIKHNLNLIKKIDKFLASKELKTNLQNMLLKNDYSTKAIINLFDPLIKYIIPDTSDFANYLYKYTVSLCFEEASELVHDKDKDLACSVILPFFSIFSELEKLHSEDKWVSKYPLNLLHEEEIEEIEDNSEYRKFVEAYHSEFVYEMMKITQDVVGYSTLDHVSGVHYLAVKIARQLKNLGFPVDLGRVSGSAAGHDIGKFGCKGEEKKRVAYYHYHYTGEWFNRHNIVYIRNIAINHSTWDLELENLSLESLILIYSDFRVKENSNKKMQIYSLDQSFQIILNKLDNVDQTKELRYKKVYSKLKDFDLFIKDLGVNVDPDSDDDIKLKTPIKRKYYALMQGNQIIENAKFESIKHNIKLMHILRDESSLNAMLQNARNAKSQSELRGYIQILQEYSTYLTQKQKLIALKFLYERLIIPEEDLRNECAMLIGSIIATFDEKIRKEIPEAALIKKPIATSIELFEKYLENFIKPDHKIIEKHRSWISYSASEMIASYFEVLDDKQKRKKSIDIVLSYVKEDSSQDYNLYLMAMIRNMPFEEFTEDKQLFIREYLFNKVTSDDYLTRLTATYTSYKVINYMEENSEREQIVQSHFSKLLDKKLSFVENYSIYKVLKKFNAKNELAEIFKKRATIDEQKISEIFLSNLKVATEPIVKKLQIEILLEYVQKSNSFYTALHFSNLLKISALSFVRNTAGEGLIKIIDRLSKEQKNDIVIELLRSLEMESYQFTRYIPLFLGRLILKLDDVEFEEILTELENKIRNSNSQISILVIKTVGVSINYYSEYQNSSKTNTQNNKIYTERLKRMIGILFCGFVNSNTRVNQVAFRIFGKYIFSSELLGLTEKKLIFDMSCKKILELMSNTDESNDLVFLNNTAGLMNIYKFISSYNFIAKKQIKLKVAKNVAFFPGTFDPFTLSHKQIAKEIRDLGFEVYLAIDEFSWSKRTQPNLTRRDIVKMSIADEIGIYSYPRDLSINIANTEDIKKLKQSFKNSKLHIVVGSDVIKNASAYKNGIKKGSITSFPHIVFIRSDNTEKDTKLHTCERMKKLHPDSILLTLPVQYENISSTRIRNYVDKDRDISELIDPMVQRYIYERGLYQREPQFKSTMTTKTLNIELIKKPSTELTKELANLIESESEFENAYNKLKQMLINNKQNRILILRNTTADKELIGFSIFHGIKSANIYNEFSDSDITEYIRESSVGRIIHITGVHVKKSENNINLKQRVLTETLAFCLSKDYTYAVYTETLSDKISEDKQKLLKLQGFIPIENSTQQIYCVNMTSPCTLNLDCKSMLKEPFRNNPNVVNAIHEAREKLQLELVKLYSGNLVLNFDRSMIYEHLIKKICDENNMPTTPLSPKTVGDLMCVPFGGIFRRWLLPNTITKSMHLEKYFQSDLKKHKVEAHPYYLDLDNQVKTLKSFNKKIILVDDLLVKGYRIDTLIPAFKNHNVNIHKVLVGILSGSGKAIMQKKGMKVDSAYFIPRLKTWFNESHLYPFLGGDAILKDKHPTRNLLPSINLILPYSSMAYIKDVSNAKLYNLSKVCLENTISIMSTIEQEYQLYNDRMLTIGRLGEIVIQPRFPDRGDVLKLDVNTKPSEYLKNDLEQLNRMESILMDKN